MSVTLLHANNSSSKKRRLLPSLPGFDDINRYWDRTHNTHAAKITPGQYYVSKQPELIVTVLGSCVSACIRDRVNKIGGMNHFMLPINKRDDGTTWGSTQVNAGNRYGNFAMENLINDILKYGGSRNNLEVKLFGGGRVLAQMTDVGQKNIQFVYDYVTTEGLNLCAEDLGGIHPRKVLYDPLSGRVRVKKLRSMHNNTIVDREQNYMHDLEEQPVQGEIDLF